MADLEAGLKKFRPGVQYLEACLEKLEPGYENFEPVLETFATDGTAHERSAAELHPRILLTVYQLTRDACTVSELTPTILSKHYDRYFIPTPTPLSRTNNNNVEFTHAI